ncbi:MAG: SulP family inorganic anion transporter [Verrucomicrobiota bacterium]
MTTAPWFKPALLRTLRAGYTKSDFLADLSAGLLVGVVALPLSMGLAIASGVKPEQGLYTAIIGGLIVALLGGSRVQVAGPAGAFVGICATGVLLHGYIGLALATLMAGFILLCFGFLRLGKYIGYIPYPVVIGFTTGIAFIIGSTQLGPALGIADPAQVIPSLIGRLQHLCSGFNQIKSGCLVVAVATLAIIVLCRKISLKIPGALLAVIAGTIVVSLLGLREQSIPTIGSKFKEISASFHLTNWTATLPDSAAWLTKAYEVFGLALGIALLVGVESLLCAVVADGMSGDRHDSDTELTAQGFANIASACFMGLPVTGVIARTSTNARAGAKSPISSIIHCLTVLAILLILAPLVKLIPLASLAGVLLSVCWYMAELPLWPRLFKSGGSDLALLVIACLITVFVDLIWAVGLGVLAGFIFLLIRKSSHPEKEEPETIEIQEGDAEVRLTLSGHLHFGRAAEPRAVEARLKRGTLHLTLDFSHALFIDCSYAQALRELALQARKQGVTVRAVGLDGRSAADFDRFGLREVIAL